MCRLTTLLPQRDAGSPCTFKRGTQTGSTCTASGQQLALRTSCQAERLPTDTLYIDPKHPSYLQILPGRELQTHPASVPALCLRIAPFPATAQWVSSPTRFHATKMGESSTNMCLSKSKEILHADVVSDTGSRKCCIHLASMMGGKPNMQLLTCIEKFPHNAGCLNNSWPRTLFPCEENEVLTAACAARTPYLRNIGKNSLYRPKPPSELVKSRGRRLNFRQFPDAQSSGMQSNKGNEDPRTLREYLACEFVINPQKDSMHKPCKEVDWKRCFSNHLLFRALSASSVSLRL
jgi:hypothetical protein